MSDTPDFVLVNLDCGCQDVHFADGIVDREHDHVECTGFPDDFQGAGPMFAAIPLGEPWLYAATRGATTYVVEDPWNGSDLASRYFPGQSAFLDKEPAQQLQRATGAELVRWEGLNAHNEPEARLWRPG